LIYSGALEPQFFAALLKGLSLHASDLPGDRNDRKHWPAIADIFTQRFRSKSRAEWERIFDGTDACVTPVLDQAELEESGYDQRPLVTLRDTPGLAIGPSQGDTRPAHEGQGEGVEGAGWSETGLAPGEGGEDILQEWMNWHRGEEYDVDGGGLVLGKPQTPAKARL